MKKNRLYIALIVLSSFACTENKTTEEGEPETDGIKITKEQFQAGNMKFGTIESKSFSNSFQFSGQIVPNVNGSANISVPVEGIIHQVQVQKGQTVKEGQVVLEVGGNKLIDLQQALASSSAKMKQLKAEFDRVNVLYQDNIKTENEYLLANSAYKSEMAIYTALKLKLENIGLNSVDIEKGIYVSSYKLKSPIAGQIVKLNASLGQFVSPDRNVVEIINTKDNVLEMAVFERDYSKIVLGQKVLFRSTGENNFRATATVVHVSRVLDVQSKSFECFAEISKADKEKYIINQLVRGEVVLGVDSVYAIAQEAIVKSGNNKYVFLKESENEEAYYLTKMKVHTGRTNNGFVELIDVPNKGSILISGAYHLGAE